MEWRQGKGKWSECSTGLLIWRISRLPVSQSASFCMDVQAARSPAGVFVTEAYCLGQDRTRQTERDTGWLSGLCI
jgi:hypothetical protein